MSCPKEVREMKRWRSTTLIICAIIAAMSMACTNPVTPDTIDEKPSDDSEQKYEPDDEPEQDAGDEPDTEDEMADKTAPTGLPEKKAYFVLDNDKRVFGVSDDGTVEQIKPEREVEKEVDGEAETKTERVRVEDLYTVDGDIYLIEREAEKGDDGEPTGEDITHRWRQKSGSDSFESIKEKDLPDKPEMEHAELSGTHYTVSIGEYNGEPISVVERPNKPTEKLHHIEAAIEIDAGLLVSVREGRGTARRPGLALYQSQHPHEYQRLRNSDAVGRLWAR